MFGPKKARNGGENAENIPVVLKEDTRVGVDVGVRVLGLNNIGSALCRIIFVM